MFDPYTAGTDKLLSARLVNTCAYCGELKEEGSHNCHGERAEYDEHHYVSDREEAECDAERSRG